VYNRIVSRLGGQEQLVWSRKRRTVLVGRSTWAQAAGLFLIPTAAGVAVLLLDGPTWLPLACVALGGVLAGARAGSARRPARPAPPRVEPRAGLGDETGTPAMAQPDAPVRTQQRHAVGYACVIRERGGAELSEHRKAIEAWAGEHGVSLTAVVHDVEQQPGDVGARPALRGALERIAAGAADTLVTAKLVHLSPTAANLAPLLRWLTAPPRSLVAIDLRLDTATEAGRLAASALSDVGGSERERLSARTRRGLQAARARGSGAGPASVADVPGLKERIARMREQGMTLQAIADTLNQEGVPTLRGGAKWRPSSVQRATGYRRPPSHQRSIDLPGSRPAGDDEPASSS
jgi:DNA invertase Pin-like site-specific DNA recombinase